MNKDLIKFISANGEVLDLLMDAIPIPLFIKDRSGQYVDCNKAFMNFLSISREQIIGKTVYDLWKKEEADVFFSQDEDLFNSGGTQIYETKITSSEGVPHIVQFHKQVFVDSSGAVAGFLGAIFDITEKKRLEEALAKLAATDELTGLLNRREGMARLELLHKHSERKKHPYCVAMVDIDHFKRLNDQYGHTNGDLVLKAFADLMRKNLRYSDVCFRYGGEEFVVLMPETDLQEGCLFAERLRRTWAECVVALPGGLLVQSTISIGVAQYLMNDASFDSLIQAGDRALYKAKDNGRNCIVCVQPEPAMDGLAP